LACRKILLQEVWRDVECVLAVRRWLEFMGSDHASRVLSHRTPHSAVPNTQAQFVHLRRHSGATMTALAQFVLVADMRQKHHVAPLLLPLR
jgi:hypothetical protein